MLLSARTISKSYGFQPLFGGVSLVIDEGDRLGLIGPNGAGKSTLLKLLAASSVSGAVLQDVLGGLDDGEIVTAKGLRAVYVAQQEAFDEGKTARDVLIDAAMEAGGGATGVGHRLDHHEAEVVADMVLERLGFAQSHAGTKAGALSGGWRKRLSIARGLASCGGSPDLLLLDEPTNHLDLEGIRWLEEFVLTSMGVAGERFASVFVTHDRAFLENVATSIVELSGGYPQGTLRATGNYTEFLRRKSDFLEAQAKAQQSLSQQVKKDLAWLARGPEARRTKSKSRIQSSHGRIDELATLKARAEAADTGGARVDFNSTGRKTRKLIEAKAVSKALGGRALFSDVSFALGVGDCLGLLGPNGSGKTTLLKVLTGELAPDTGEVSRSEPPPRVAVFSQHRKEIEATTLLRDALNPGGEKVWFRGSPMHITGWSRRFLFRDEQLDQAIRTLSGGELARVHIARIMLEPADVLVLDEPTNDLDIPTLETLEEALEEFPGALVLVTHDRAMLDRLASSVLVLDGRGGSRVVGSVQQAMAWTQERVREAAGLVVAEPAKVGAATAAAGGGAPAVPAPAAPPSRKKLGYSEQREYDLMESRITEAEAEAAKAEMALGNPAVIADHARMAGACDVLGRAQAEVERLYARWEELEAKRG